MLMESDILKLDRENEDEELTDKFGQTIELKGIEEAMEYEGE